MKTDCTLVVDVVVIGAGPAGLFAGIALSQSNLDVVVLDKGKLVQDRKCAWDCDKHPETCDVSCGVGGAGLFSDGCLHYSTKIGGDTVNPSLFECYKPIIDKIYSDSGLSQYIGYPKREFLNELKGLNLKYADIEQRVFGEDKVVELVYYLVSLWTTPFQSGKRVLVPDEKVVMVQKTPGQGFIVHTDHGDYVTKYVIFATGQWDHTLIHESCRSLGISVSKIPTSYGFRIETHYDRLSDVTARFYNWKVYGEKFRTFCVNNHGRILMHRGEYGRLSTNGSHSNVAPTDNTNLAIISYMPADYMVELMLKRPANLPPMLQRWEDLLGNRATSPERLEFNTVHPTLKRYCLSNMWDFFGTEIVESFISDMHNFRQFSPNMIHNDLLVTGPEWKYFYLNYPLSERYESLECPGVFFVGDTNANSYAIVMASLSGFVAGEEIYRKEVALKNKPV